MYSCKCDYQPEPFECLFGTDINKIITYPDLQINIDKFFYSYNMPGGSSRMTTLNDTLWSLNNFTPLMLASARGCCDVVDILLSYGANVNIKSRDNHTAVHYAVIFNNYDVVIKLIAAGANGSIKNAWGKTPLHCAVALDNIDIVLQLIPITDLSIIDMDGKTPLTYAQFHNKLCQSVLF